MSDNWLNKWVTCRCEKCGKRNTQKITNLMNSKWECDVCSLKSPSTSLQTVASHSIDLSLVPVTRVTSGNKSTRKGVSNENRMVTVLCETCKKEITRTIKYFRRTACWKCEVCSMKSSAKPKKTSIPATITSPSTSQQVPLGQPIDLSSSPEKRCTEVVTATNVCNCNAISYIPVPDCDNILESNLAKINPIPCSSIMNCLNYEQNHSNADAMVLDTVDEIPVHGSASITEEAVPPTGEHMSVDNDDNNPENTVCVASDEDMSSSIDEPFLPHADDDISFANGLPIECIFQ